MNMRPIILALAAAATAAALAFAGVQPPDDPGLPPPTKPVKPDPKPVPAPTPTPVTPPVTPPVKPPVRPDPGALGEPEGVKPAAPTPTPPPAPAPAGPQTDPRAPALSGKWFVSYTDGKLGKVSGTAEFTADGSAVRITCKDPSTGAESVMSSSSVKAGPGSATIILAGKSPASARVTPPDPGTMQRLRVSPKETKGEAKSGDFTQAFEIAPRGEVDLDKLTLELRWTGDKPTTVTATWSYKADPATERDRDGYGRVGDFTMQDDGAAVTGKQSGTETWTRTAPSGTPPATPDKPKPKPIPTPTPGGGGGDPPKPPTPPDDGGIPLPPRPKPPGGSAGGSAGGGGAAGAPGATPLIEKPGAATKPPESENLPASKKPSKDPRALPDGTAPETTGLINPSTPPPSTSGGQLVKAPAGMPMPKETAKFVDPKTGVKEYQLGPVLSNSGGVVRYQLSGPAGFENNVLVMYDPAGAIKPEQRHAAARNGSDLLTEAGAPQMFVLVWSEGTSPPYRIERPPAPGGKVLAPPRPQKANETADSVTRGGLSANEQRAVLELFWTLAGHGLIWEDARPENIVLNVVDGEPVASVLDPERVAKFEEWKSNPVLSLIMPVIQAAPAQERVRLSSLQEAVMPGDTVERLKGGKSIYPSAEFFMEKMLEYGDRFITFDRGTMKFRGVLIDPKIAEEVFPHLREHIDFDFTGGDGGAK